MSRSCSRRNRTRCWQWQFRNEKHDTFWSIDGGEKARRCPTRRLKLAWPNSPKPLVLLSVGNRVNDQVEETSQRQRYAEFSTILGAQLNAIKGKHRDRQDQCAGQTGWLHFHQVYYLAPEAKDSTESRRPGEAPDPLNRTRTWERP